MVDDVKGPQLRIDNRGSIRWLIIDNPARLNAFTTSMWAALPRLIREAEEDGDVRAVVLTGAGDRAGLLPPGTVAPGLIAQVSPAHPVVAAGCSICPAGFSR